MKSQRSRRREAVLLAVVLVAGLAYALARYVVFGTTAAANIPVYVVNKAVAIAAAAGLFLAAWCRLRDRAQSKVFWLRAAGGLAALHVLLTLAILNRAYFGKFFEGERLSLGGESAVLLGVLTACACMVWRQAGANGARCLWGILACLLLAGHLLAMGFSGWLTPANWPRGMPPITLIGFFLAVTAAAMWAVRRRGL